jgi:A118 family predicted phage portal protein
MKGVLAKMNLVKTIKSVTDFASVQETETQYNRILAWKQIYAGYLPRFDGEEFHETTWKDVYGATHKRRRASMNMAKVACEQMAALVFNQKCNINVSTVLSGVNDDGTPKTPTEDLFSVEVMNVLDDNYFKPRLTHEIEHMFAEGGLVIKPYFDGERIRITFVTADNFLPLASRDGLVTDGVFINQFTQDKKFYTLLEWHQWNGDVYVIKNQLFQAESVQEIGHEIALATLYPDMEPEIDFNNLSRPLFIYLKPNIANNFETDSPLGLSLFANSLDTLKTLDIWFDSFQREAVLGRRRVIVPDSAVKVAVNEQGETRSYFDPDDEVYQAIKFRQGVNAGTNAVPVEQLEAQLRVSDHVSAINANLNAFGRQIGFSAGTFSFDAAGATIQTATQVVSENSQTFRTKQDHEVLVEQAIKGLVTTIAELAQAYSLFSVPDNFDVSIDFDDSIAEDKIASSSLIMSQVAADLMPKKEAIKRLYGMTDEQAQEWIEQIKAEAPPIATNLFGADEQAGAPGDA